MKKVLDIGYGKEELLEMFHNGEISSRLFYGMIQLENKFNIQHVSLSSHGGLLGFIINNIRLLRNADIVFMSYIYESSLILLALLKHIGLCNRKIVVISHNTLKNSGRIFERLLFKLVYSSIDIILFHSQKNLDESVKLGLVSSERVMFFYWGDDLIFVDSAYKSSISPFFISTGRENRDFELLVNAFARTKSNLELYTNRINYDTDYSFLHDAIGKHSNIRIEFVDKSTKTTRLLAQRTAESCCVVIPLLHHHIRYCVGLTSVVEAMALGKPIISSPNPYSPIDLEREGIGIYADTIDEWEEALKFFEENPQKTQEMGKRARQLAEKHYNINETANILEKIFIQ